MPDVLVIAEHNENDGSGLLRWQLFPQSTNRMNWDLIFCFTSQFIWGLGVPEDVAEFNDVYGLDEELLEMVPKPVLAVLFLFPYSKEVTLSMFSFVYFLF